MKKMFYALMASTAVDVHSVNLDEDYRFLLAPNPRGYVIVSISAK